VSGRGKRFFSSPQLPDRLQAPLSFLSDKYRESFTGVKRPGREADHSPQSSAEVRMVELYIYSYTSIRLHDVVLN
jgi:hypothetical protein